MTEQLEHEVRRVFADDADRAPSASAIVQEARRWARRRRNSRLAWGAGGLIAASAVAVAMIGGGFLSEPPAGDQVATPPVASTLGHQQPGSGSGALPDGGGTRCAETYSADAVKGRAFAFDGTVTAIAPGRTNRPSEGQLELVAVTFAVTEWFTGGPDATVTVDMVPPIEEQVVEDSPPTYEIGTRLLVSGEPRWGGSPLAGAIAWGCGFTRYYDASAAKSWSAATQ